MSYERQAIADSASTPTVPAASPAVMREEAVYDPYRVKAKTPLIGQPDTTETPKAEEKKPTEDAVRLSPQVAALARKEQRFRQQQQALEKDRATLASEKAELAQLRDLKAKLDAKDYSGLEGVVDYNDYSQYQIDKLNGSDPTQDALRAIQAKVDGIEKQSQAQVKRQFEAAVQERRIATEQLVDKSDQFPRIKKAKAHEAVVQHILDTWEQDSKELSVEDAAKEVEEVLLEKAKQWAALLEEEKKAPIEETKATLPPLKPGLKTLTNQVTTGDVKRPQRPLQHMSDSERWAEARRRAEEKLKLGR